MSRKLIRKPVRVPKKLGKNVKKLRTERGLTQEELAFKIGISRAYIGYIEQGRNVPSFRVLQKLSKVLKTKPQDLF